MEPSIRWLRPCLVPFAIFAVAMTLYFILRQESAYGDAPSAILEIRNGAVLGHAHHYMYLPMIAGAHSVLGPFGWTLFDVGRAASATGGAAAGAFAYVAAQILGLTRVQSTLAAALLVTCPAVMFFSTTMEFHGPFLGFASLALVAFCTATVRGNVSWCVVTGMLTALAYLAHASAHLFVGSLAVSWIVMTSPGFRRDAPLSLRRRVALGGCMVVTHAIACALLAAGVGALRGYPAGSGQAASFVSGFGTRIWSRPGLLADVAWFEFLWPYMPLVLASALLFRPGKWRRIVLALGLSLPAYFALCVLLLPGFDEHGAYQLPLVWMLAIPLSRCASKTVCTSAVVVSIALGVIQIRTHDNPRPALDFAKGVVEFAGRGPMTLLIGGDFVTSQAAAVHLGAIDTFEVFDIGKIVDGPSSKVLQFLPLFDAHMARRFAGGRAVVIARTAYDMLTMPLVRSVGSPDLLKEHLDRAYTLVPVSAGSFEGLEITARR